MLEKASCHWEELGLLVGPAACGPRLALGMVSGGFFTGLAGVVARGDPGDGFHEGALFAVFADQLAPGNRVQDGPLSPGEGDKDYQQQEPTKIEHAEVVAGSLL